MYEIPADFDPQIFVGREVTSLTFAQNVIHVNFDDGLAVSVSDSIFYRTAMDAEELVDTPPFVDSPPLSSTSLVSFIGREVTSGKVASSYELVIGFEGGGYMRFVDPMEGHESFIITIGDTEIIV